MENSNFDLESRVQNRYTIQFEPSWQSSISLELIYFYDFTLQDSYKCEKEENKENKENRRKKH